MNVFSSLRLCSGRLSVRRALITCAALVAAAPAGADERPRILYDLQLNTSIIRLESIDALSITYEDEFGAVRSRPTSSVLAILPAANAGDEATASSRTSWLLLADGQRYPGQLAPTVGDEETVAWVHDEFGHMQFPIESVRAVALPEADENALRLELASDITEDVVALANGDRYAGFILSVSEMIEIETDAAGILAFEPERVSWVLLATEDEPMEGMAIWLRDGAVASLDETRAAVGGGFEARLRSGASAQFPVEDIEAIVFNAERIRSLTDLRTSEETPVGRRWLTEPTLVEDFGPLRAPLGRRSAAPDLRLPGPMRVEWDLPPGASRFSATARMPKSAFPWGDCELVITVDDLEVHRVRLNEDAPAAQIGVDVRGDRLAVTVEPGEYGPIRDQVVLKRAMLLITAGR